jgi:predicted nucleic acid-binding Zn ribbon protein
MSDDPLTECPVCGGDVRRVVGSVGIVFKGKGFYVTDHRGSNGGGRVQTPESSSSAGSEGGSDKPAKDKGSDSNKASDAKSSAASSSTAAAPSTS